jgi:hypothetical protein
MMAAILVFLLILKVARSAGKLAVVRAGNSFASLLGSKAQIGLGSKRLFANCITPFDKFSSRKKSSWKLLMVVMTWDA